MSKYALALAGLLLIVSLNGGEEMAGGSKGFFPVGFFLTPLDPLEGDRVRPYAAFDRDRNTMRALILGAVFGHLPKASLVAD